MPDAAMSGRNVLVVDDDVIMRELLGVLLGMEGYAVQAVESGEQALAALRDGLTVDVILLDLHMPGVHGAELATRLTAACSPETLLLGMSGGKLQAADAGLFAGFLEKPFGVEEFAEAISTARLRVGKQKVGDGEAKALATGSVLDEAIYTRMANMLPAAQLRELYRITLEDVQRRVGLMRASLLAGDEAAVRAEAHSIKGGSGMVGALELSRLAADVEAGSALPGNPPFADFDAACTRLQVMLDARN